MTLVFDTYIETLMAEIKSTRRRAETYAQSLEEKAKLPSKYAERDALTGLYNKRGMEKILSNELRMARRRHTLLSIIYLDVNKFKQINDTYGHARGDEALKQVATCITQNVRTSDFPCRVGSDEFCIILSDCDRNSANAIGGRIATQFSFSPAYSASIGVAETGAQEYVNEETLISIADKQMYVHKSGSPKNVPPEEMARADEKKSSAAG